MIKNERPYTIENGTVDAALLTDLDYYDIDRVMGWIQDNILPAKNVLEGWTSYGLKHLLEDDTKQYLTNNQFKDAMILSGYAPVDPDELNWHYRIELKRDVIINPSPFYQWAVHNFIDESSPCGDFARDMVDDRDFPKVADKRVIQSYLDGIHACDGAEEAFSSLWRHFEKAGLSVVPRRIK